MGAYILRRLILIVPTLLGILLLNFVVLQFSPGGPVESLIAKIENVQGGTLDRIGGGGGDGLQPGQNEAGPRGIDQRFIDQFREKYGLDEPVWKQFVIMVGNYFTFDFGDSFFKGAPVVDLLLDKLPVSLTLGFWSLLLTYAISIPLGVRKAVRDGSRFDSWTSAIIIAGYAIPVFLFGILLLVFFAGGSYWQIFPNRGLHSVGSEDWPFWRQALDYFHHIVLPVTAMAIGGFAALTLLTKNSFLDEIKKQYVTTARAKGLTERRVLYRHIFRNAMLIIIAGFPAAFIAIFTTSSLIIENLFSLDGLGVLAITAIGERDFPIILGTLFIFSLLALITQLVTDITYTLVDPRIDFERR